MRRLLPVPDVPVRPKRSAHLRKCNCGGCRLCQVRAANRRMYRRRKYLGPDLDGTKLEAYWDRIKTDD